MGTGSKSFGGRGACLREAPGHVVFGGDALSGGGSTEGEDVEGGAGDDLVGAEPDGGDGEEEDEEDADEDGGGDGTGVGVSGDDGGGEGGLMAARRRARPSMPTLMTPVRRLER